jgi:hypothetical protein
MNPETYIHNNTVKTHHGRHAQQKQIPKSNNVFTALRTIPLQNNAQILQKEIAGPLSKQPELSKPK